MRRLRYFGSFLGEVVQFAKQNKVYWIVPLVLILGLVILLVALLPFHAYLTTFGVPAFWKEALLIILLIAALVGGPLVRALRRSPRRGPGPYGRRRAHRYPGSARCSHAAPHAVAGR